MLLCSYLLLLLVTSYLLLLLLLVTSYLLLLLVTSYLLLVYSLSILLIYITFVYIFFLFNFWLAFSRFFSVLLAYSLLNLSITLYHAQCFIKAHCLCYSYTLLLLNIMLCLLLWYEFKFILKANITIEETNINYRTCISNISVSRKISEDKGMSV